ncbi:hypothetical protein V5O48_006480 [Marasmius crinis-equi]|uniref:C2H2-type domain-containing protein n=1 Tax=Marasmius crinis-equi TaxID=585013 RepID=A0ABR3FJE3_9AGAR
MRGRSRSRVSLGNRYNPAGPSSRSSSFGGNDNVDYSAMQSLSVFTTARRQRSSSVISSSSSVNGDVSDSDGYFSANEMYESSRDPSPFGSQREPFNGDFTTSGPGGYRTHIGSPAIAKASHERRRKPAKFFCEQRGCSSSFTTRQNLKSESRNRDLLLVHPAKCASLDHINSHLGIKKYKCNFCPKDFTTLHVRDRHQTTCKSNPSKASKAPMQANQYDTMFPLAYQ